MVVCSFLPFRDLTRLLPCSKELYNWCSRYLKLWLQERSLIHRGPVIQESCAKTLRKKWSEDNSSAIIVGSRAQDSKKRRKKTSFHQEMQEISLLKKISLHGDCAELERIADDFPIANCNQALTVPYHIMYRSLFGREVLLADLNASKPFNENGELPMRRINFLFGEGIKEVRIGSKFTAFLMLNDELIFLKTSEYLDGNFSGIGKCRRRKVKKYSTEGLHLIILRENGQVLIVFHDDRFPSHELREEVIEATSTFPVDDIEFSYNYLLMIFKQDNEGPLAGQDPAKAFIPNLPSSPTKNVIPQEETKEGGRKTSENPAITQSFIALLLVDLQPEHINLKKGIFTKIDLQDAAFPLKSACIGAQNAYFVTNKGTLLGSDLKIPFNAQEHVPVVTAKALPKLEKRHFYKVFSGFLYYYAIERDDVQPIDQWTNEQVLSWARELGFADYMKILRFEKVNGADLIKVNRKYLADTLGMSREDLQTKFLTEVCRNLESSHKNQILWGWGANKNGQLGLFNTANVIAPMKIDVPQAEGDLDSIDNILCGKNHTVLMTKNGKIWISQNLAAKANAKLVTATLEAEESNTNGNGRKGGKKDHHKKERTPVLFQAPNVIPSWLDVTGNFIALKDSRKYSVISGTLSKNFLGILASFEGEKKPPRRAGCSKMRDVDQVARRIDWDAVEEYVVGYEDKPTRILEIAADEYVNAVPQLGKARYLKHKGVIIWGFDKLN